VVPYRSIEEVVDRLPSSQGDLTAIPTEDSDAARRARAMLATVDVEFRVEIGTIELPLERVLAFRPGDVVSLGRPAAAGVTVFADEVPTHVARPGRRGSRRAVEIVGRSD
jgi:flagellar motor switch protein FliM